MLDQGRSSSGNTIQVCLAIIGLIGALGGAAIANWDKIFPHPLVVSSLPSPVDAGPPLALTPEKTKEHITLKLEPPQRVPAQSKPVLSLVSPSFNCARTTYPSERLVCASPELSFLDLALANAYRDAAARIKTRERKASLRQQQNYWLRNDREACEDVACLKSTYQQRIFDLQEVGR